MEIYHKIRLQDKKKFDSIVLKEFKKNFFKEKKKNDLFKKNLVILKSIPKKFKNFNILHPLRVSFYSTIFFKNNYDLMSLCIFHNLFEIENINKIEYKKFINKKTFKHIEALTIDKKKKFNRKYVAQYYKKLMKSPKIVQFAKCLDKFDNLYNLNKNPDINIKKKYLKEIKNYIVPIVKNNKIFNKYLKLMIKTNYQQIKNG